MLSSLRDKAVCTDVLAQREVDPQSLLGSQPGQTEELKVQ